MPEGILASVALLTFNGEKYLNEVLEAVFSQKTAFASEVVVIDSGSTDRTLEILASYPVRLHRIPNSEFNHGETRNLAARMARGQFVAYLTQDATPANDQWLQHLIDAFEIGPKVAAVYGLHIPRPDCDPPTRRDSMEFFAAMGPADQPTVRSIAEGEGRQEYQRNEGIIGFYSDVNSCLRKSVWEKIPYRPLDYAEDQAFGRDILEAGYWKVYEPRAAVIHSHTFPLHNYFQRQFDEYRGLRRSIGTGKIVVEFFSVAISRSVCRYLSVKALGCSARIFAASDNLCAAWNSPSAAMTLERRSRSASACFAIARCIS